MWGPPVISWFRFTPVTSSLFAYHKPYLLELLAPTERYRGRGPHIVYIYNISIFNIPIYISHRIHVWCIYIYANKNGVYWWDPCYHIWQHHGSYGYIYRDVEYWYVEYWCWILICYITIESTEYLWSSGCIYIWIIPTYIYHNIPGRLDHRGVQEGHGTHSGTQQCWSLEHRAGGSKWGDGRRCERLGKWWNLWGILRISGDLWGILGIYGDLDWLRVGIRRTKGDLDGFWI